MHRGETHSARRPMQDKASSYTSVPTSVEKSKQTTNFESSSPSFFDFDPALGHSFHGRRIFSSIKDPLQHLPPEIAVHILSFLTDKELCYASCVSRVWYGIANDGKAFDNFSLF